MSMRQSLLLSLIVCAVATPAGAAAQNGEPVPMPVAERIHEGERIVLDGRLDEPVWQRAIPATEFRQQEPVEGAAPTERTEVPVALSDDRLMWILDTFRDGRTAYFFEINPAGLLGDGLLRISSGSNVNKSWDGIWDVRVRQHGEGWTAEIRFPFARSTSTRAARFGASTSSARSAARTRS
jgi:hypothetical protein